MITQNTSDLKEEQCPDRMSPDMRKQKGYDIGRTKG